MKTYYSKYLIIKNKKRRITTYALTEKGQLQRCFDAEVKSILIDSYKPSEYSFAYQKGENVLSNASVHIENTEFLLMDIKDFFPSINHKILEKEIINQVKANKKEYLIDLELVKPLLRKIVGTSKCGIQQGLICSPILSDIYLTSFDNLLVDSLESLEKNSHDQEKGEYSIFNIKYSRYADDITISFSPNYNNSEVTRRYKREIVAIVRNLLQQYKLKINEKKTHYISSSESDSVKITGLNLNFNTLKIRVSKKYMNDLFWDTLEKYECLVGTGTCTDVVETLEFLEKLIGKEAFISSIDPDYFKLEYSKNMQKIVYDYNYIDLKHMLVQTKRELLEIHKRK